MDASPPPKDFSFHPSLVKFNVPYKHLLATINSTLSTPLDGIATGAIIFKTYHDESQPRILLVQRSSTDSMPNKWEIPGGAVDPGETILAGVAREVLEETGLSVKAVVGLLEHDDEQKVDGGYVFHTRRGRKIIKFTLVVEVEDASTVRLDPEEHQDCVWATEEECRAKRAARRAEERELGKRVVELEYTTFAQETTVFDAFSTLKNEKGP